MQISDFSGTAGVLNLPCAQLMGVFLHGRECKQTVKSGSAQFSGNVLLQRSNRMTAILNIILENCFVIFLNSY